MKKDKKYHNSQQGDSQRKRQSQRPEYGYIYLVKNPSSNELTVCASEERLDRGTHVIAPTRYGVDYGMVVGSAMEMGQYEPGSMEVQGSCLHGEPIAQDDDLVASAEPEHPEPVVEEQSSVAKESTCGPCKGCNGSVNRYRNENPVKITGEVDWIERIANEEDYQRFLELNKMEDEALVLCREKVLVHGLDMKLVSAHYLFGESKVIFFFTAANRVDFRDLVKDLVSVFRIRIELRQIGVRDESRVLGGLAVCGRDFCCHGITDKLNPVSIKMAKEQNLSLNSTKISGPCGRLLCCLSYEYDFYVEEKRNLPPEGSRLKIQHELMKITEVNILSRKISLIGTEGRHLTIPFSAVYYNDDHSRWEVERSYLDEFLSN
jgi:cell fate regulator YaaT (PSP1 superfamily)